MARNREESVLTTGSEVRTFLIADVRGYTRFTLEQGDEAAARLATRFAQIAEAAVSPHQGQLLEVRGDEILAVFRSARHALQAAVDLQRRLAQEMATNSSLPLRVGVGLDAGEAIPVNGGFRGASLNLAARLCSLAGPGEVLASEAVTHLARRVEGLHYADRGPVQLKGFAELVRVLVVQPEEGVPAVEGRHEAGVSPTPLPIGGFLGALPAAPMVARREELERALAAVDAVAGGAGRLLLLASEPGVGKTRLAQEVTLALRNRGFLVTCGRCYEPQAAVPYYPFLDALATLYAIAPVALRVEAPRQWPHLERLLPAEMATTAAPGSESPEEQQRLFHAVTDFLQTLASEAPVALMLDDLHWADSASLDLFAHLARHTRAHRVLVLGTYRDVEVSRQHPLERILRDLGREGLAERIAVRRLDADGTAALMAGSLGEEAVSAEFASLIYRRTEGNPFFTQEVLRALVERGDVFRREGEWDRRAIGEIEVPESVRSTIGERLSRLSEEAQETLREASVLGPTFDFDHLLSMSERTDSELEDLVEEAIGAGLVREGEGDAYAFNHALTQIALYAELPRRRRRRLHLAAAEAMDRSGRNERAAECAWHFLEGDDPERALPYALRAGDEASVVFAHAEAERQYRTAMELARDVGDRAAELTAQEKRLHALRLMARYAEALEVAEEAVQAYRETGDFEAEMRLTADVASLLMDLQRVDEAIECAQVVLDRWEQQPVASSGAASLFSTLGEALWRQRRVDDALRPAQRAVEVAREAGDEALLGVAESRLGMCLSGVGRTDEAIEALSRAIPLLEASQNLRLLADSFIRRAVSRENRRMYDEAWEDGLRALETTRRLGDPYKLATVLMSDALPAWYLDGDWQKARSFLDELAPLERYLRSTNSSGVIALAAWFRLVAGEVDVDRLKSVAREGQESGDLQLWSDARVQLAQWYVARDMPDEALSQIEGLPEGWAEANWGTLAAVVEAYIACGRLEEAEGMVDRYVPARKNLEQLPSYGLSRIIWIDALVAEARVRAARGRWEDARDDLEQALAFVRETGGKPAFSHGVAAHAYGDLLTQRRERGAARERLEEALSVFRGMQALPYADRTERALATLHRLD